jgi:hypothetical protein
MKNNSEKLPNQPVLNPSTGKERLELVKMPNFKERMRSMHNKNQLGSKFLATIYAPGKKFCAHQNPKPGFSVRH